MTALYIYKATGLIELAEALNGFFDALTGQQKDNQRTVALLYAPRYPHLALARKADGAVKFFNANGEVETISDVFEARVFNAVAELRWHNQSEGRGRAVVLADEGNLAFFGDEPKPEADIIDTLPQRYLLWGKSAQPSKDEWTQFATARIGAFDAPLGGLNKGDYAQFMACEYLKAYADGNVGVAQERLVGLEPVQAKRQEVKHNG